MLLSGFRFISGSCIKNVRYHIGSKNSMPAYGLGNCLRGELISLHGENKIDMDNLLFTLIFKIKV